MENVGTTVNKKVYALIGGIASGKTAVSDILRDLGAYIIDADEISHNISRSGGKGEQVLKRLFPECCCDGAPDRRKIREKVFGDAEALRRLNKAMHPLIIDEIKRQISMNEGVMVVVMPIPVDLGRYSAVLNVYAPVETRIERLVKRDNISVELAKEIMAAQMTDEEAEKVSDFTFVNDGNTDELKKAVVNWWKIYVEK